MTALKLQIIPFRVRHLAEINPTLSAKAMAIARRAEECGIAWTACLLGDPVGAAGMEIGPNGIAQVWTEFSPLIKTMPKAFFQATRNYLEKAIAEHSPETLQAIVDENDDSAVRFIEHLGFPRKERKFLYERKIR